MIGLNNETRRLNIAVAVRVAATETVAVVTAVASISLDGTGTSLSIMGISICLISGGLGGFGIDGLGEGFEFTPPLTPGGALRSLGGTTRGL